MLEPPAPPRPNLTVDGIAINIASLPQAVDSIVSAAQTGDNFSVCTLNLDHVVQLQERADFRAAYRRARFVTADGFPIVVLSRLLGTRIERTTGADLVEPVCQEARKRGLPIFFLGSTEPTLATSARRLSERFKGLKVAGYFAPGPGFDPYSDEADHAIESIRSIRRATLFRRAWRAAPGSVRRALPRRARWNRHVVHRRRSRFHRRQAKPRTVHYAKIRSRMGVADAARAAPAGAPLRALHGRRSADSSHAPFRKSSTHASGKRHDLYPHSRAAGPQRRQVALSDLPHSPLRSARRKGRRSRDLHPRLHHLSSLRYRSSLHRRGFAGRPRARRDS